MTYMSHNKIYSKVHSVNFWRDRRSRVQAELVLLLFLITYQIRKAFIFNKNAGNEQNLETQVFNIIVFIRFGWAREGFIVPMRWNPFINFNKNDNLHSMLLLQMV